MAPNASRIRPPNRQRAHRTTRFPNRHANLYNFENNVRPNLRPNHIATTPFNIHPIPTDGQHAVGAVTLPVFPPLPGRVEPETENKGPVIIEVIVRDDPEHFDGVVGQPMVPVKKKTAISYASVLRGLSDPTIWEDSFEEDEEQRSPDNEPASDPMATGGSGQNMQAPPVQGPVTSVASGSSGGNTWRPTVNAWGDPIVYDDNDEAEGRSILSNGSTNNNPAQAPAPIVGNTTTSGLTQPGASATGPVEAPVVRTNTYIVTGLLNAIHASNSADAEPAPVSAPHFQFNPTALPFQQPVAQPFKYIGAQFDAELHPHELQDTVWQFVEPNHTHPVQQTPGAAPDLGFRVDTSHLEPAPIEYFRPLPEAHQQALPTPEATPVFSAAEPQPLPFLHLPLAPHPKSASELLVICANMKYYIKETLELKITRFVIDSSQLRLPCLPWPSLRFTPSIPLKDRLNEFFLLIEECQRLCSCLLNNLGKERGCALKCHEMHKMVQGQMGYLNSWLTKRSREENRKLAQWRMEFFDFNRVTYHRNNRRYQGSEAGIYINLNEIDVYEPIPDMPLDDAEDLWGPQDFAKVDKWVMNISDDDPWTVEVEMPNELDMDRLVPVWERKIMEWVESGRELNSSFFTRPRRPLRRARRRADDAGTA